MPTRGIFHRVVKDAIDRTRHTSVIILICSTTKIRNRFPFEKKLKDVCLKRFFSLLGVPCHLSKDERSLHFGSHCTVFTREKSRWLSVAISGSSLTTIVVQ